jgi:hypothetical protein
VPQGHTTTDPSKRIVTALPLQTLWDNAGRDIASTRGRPLKADDIRALLRIGRTRFVMADVGHPLRWIAPEEQYEFWKEEVQSHLCEQEQGVLEDFPGGYFYFATEWRLPGGEIAVVLEKQH